MTTTNRYSNGKIYKLVNNVDDHFYIGSTCNALHKRFYNHKRQSKSEVLPAHRHLNQIGWKNVKIVLIEEYPCQNKMELERREREFIEQLKPTLNKNIPTRGKEEYRQQNREAILEMKKQYYQKNRDIIADKVKQYRKQNGEALKKHYKQYRQENKELIAEQNKQYREKNREAIAKKKKQYQQANKEKIKAYNRERYIRKKAEAQPQS